MKFGSTLLVPLSFLLFLCGTLHAQTQPTPSQQASTKGMKLDTGEEVFNASCIGCHGPNGTGQPEHILGFEPPDTFPDFTDCNGSTRERVADWTAIIHEGGPVRGFSDIMPSWKDALTSAQIKLLTEYLRSQCQEPGWPLGELNLPRTLFTEKAFPEDEWLIQTTVNTNGLGEVSSELLYEKRIGSRSQIELALPFSFLQRSNKGWVGGVGDFVLGYKRNLFSSVRSGSIFSVGGEVIAPTGNKSKDLGSGVTTFETFGALGQILPGRSFVQIQSGVELPTDTAKKANAVFWRTAVGKTVSEDRGNGRAWTPIVEFLADRDLGNGAKTNWDIAPQVQITLNRRQHVRINIGIRTPMNNTTGRTTQLGFYALWDFFDGGLREGW